MNAVAYSLKFSSPVTALPSASGVFGHLAWRTRYREGEAALLEMLEAFQTSPPWRISSVFPNDLLPRPLLRPAADPRLAESAFRKQLKGVKYVDKKVFADILERGELALIDSVQAAIRASNQDAPKPAGPVKLANRTRAGINRLTGGAYEGLLYTDTLLQPLDTWTLYATAKESSSYDFLADALREVGAAGYGGKASVGMGRFRVCKVESATLPEAKNANGYTTLAPCLHPQQDGFYALETYWGRLGGTLTHSATPFKRPYLRVSVGSSFYGQPPEHGLLETARVGEATVYDYLYAFALGVRLEEPDGRTL